MAEYKKVGRAKRLVVAGCLVERYRGDIRKDMPEVDAIDRDQRNRPHCGGLRGHRGSPVAPIPGLYLYHDLTPRVLATPRHFAYIKIAEGCDHPCTFCVIPQYRGNFRSRRFESVVSEATRLFGQGVREINLIGQDTTCYGEDLGLKDGLAQLLARLAQIETAAAEMGSFPLRLSESGDAEAARYHRRACRTGEIHRYAAAARQRAGPEADEARGERRHFPEADREDSQDHPGRGDSHQLSLPDSRARRMPISKRCASS